MPSALLRSIPQRHNDENSKAKPDLPKSHPSHAERNSGKIHPSVHFCLSKNIRKLVEKKKDNSLRAKHSNVCRCNDLLM